MALKLEKCIIKQDTTIPVSSDITTLEEGLALVRKIENGALVAAIASGDPDEVFIGFSMNRHQAPGSAVGRLTVTIPTTAPYTVDLGRTILNGEISVYINDTFATKGSVAPTAAGNYSISGSVVTFYSADAGKTATISWRYALTQVEANLLFGTDLVSFVRLPEVNTSMIEVGTVVTDKYNLEDDWNSAVYAYAGADGILTTDEDAGPKVGYISLLPSAADGFLGVEISV